MSERKIIAVVGATGAQGGGLARAILDHPEAGFGVRALTRKTGSDKARQLQQQGADVVAADLDDRASLEAAFAGAEAAYCVTNFWEHFSPERELQQAENLAAAAAAARLRHVIWSTLEDTRRWVPLDDPRLPTLMDRYKVPHFDAKGEADRFFIDAGVPATFLLTSFYWDNLIYFGSGPTRAPDGILHLTLPMGDARLPGIAAADIGRCALGIFRAPERYRGQTVGIAGEHLTGGEMAQALSLALGEAVLYNAISPDEYRTLGFPGAADLGNMFQFKRDFNAYYCGARSIEHSRELNPDLQTFDAWLANHAGEIPLE
jgi:uncharacterized protein YbjT (DUF2867 family)